MIVIQQICEEMNYERGLIDNKEAKPERQIHSYETRRMRCLGRLSNYITLRHQSLLNTSL
jgi:hypothetical protein